jgi:hypothetical protein
MEPTSPNHPSESKREERRQYSRTKVAVAVELQSDKASTPQSPHVLVAPVTVGEHRGPLAGARDLDVISLQHRHE